MVRHKLKKHKYKILFGAPIIFLLASSISFSKNTDNICITSEDNTFVKVGKTITVDIMADADNPINVISTTVNIPKDLISVEQISKENSIIDLWSEEPKVVDDSKIYFSGGIIDPKGFTGKGKVLSITLKPIKEGTATLSFEETKMLAHDGTGREVGCKNNPMIITIRGEDKPSPDVNGDKKVNIFDFGIVSARLFMTYEQSYDLNLDGKITITDIIILISNMHAGSGMSSLAFSLLK
jgi:hypothetical protein